MEKPSSNANQLSEEQRRLQKFFAQDGLRVQSKLFGRLDPGPSYRDVFLPSRDLILPAFNVDRSYERSALISRARILKRSRLYSFLAPRGKDDLYSLANSTKISNRRLHGGAVKVAIALAISKDNPRRPFSRYAVYARFESLLRYASFQELYGTNLSSAILSRMAELKPTDQLPVIFKYIDINETGNVGDLLTLFSEHPRTIGVTSSDPRDHLVTRLRPDFAKMARAAPRVHVGEEPTRAWVDDVPSFSSTTSSSSSALPAPKKRLFRFEFNSPFFDSDEPLYVAQREAMRQANLPVERAEWEAIADFFIVADDVVSFMQNRSFRNSLVRSVYDIQTEVVNWSDTHARDYGRSEPIGLTRGVSLRYFNCPYAKHVFSFNNVYCTNHESGKCPVGGGCAERLAMYPFSLDTVSLIAHIMLSKILELKTHGPTLQAIGDEIGTDSYGPTSYLALQEFAEDVIGTSAVAPLLIGSQFVGKIANFIRFRGVADLHIQRGHYSIEDPVVRALETMDTIERMFQTIMLAPEVYDILDKFASVQDTAKRLTKPGKPAFVAQLDPLVSQWIEYLETYLKIHDGARLPGLLSGFLQRNMTRYVGLLFFPLLNSIVVDMPEPYFDEKKRDELNWVDCNSPSSKLAMIIFAVVADHLRHTIVACGISVDEWPKIMADPNSSYPFGKQLPPPEDRLPRMSVTDLILLPFNAFYGLREASPYIDNGPSDTIAQVIRTCANVMNRLYGISGLDGVTKHALDDFTMTILKATPNIVYLRQNKSGIVRVFDIQNWRMIFAEFASPDFVLQHPEEKSKTEYRLTWSDQDQQTWFSSFKKRVRFIYPEAISKPRETAVAIDAYLTRVGFFPLLKNHAPPKVVEECVMCLNPVERKWGRRKKCTCWEWVCKPCQKKVGDVCLICREKIK